MFFSDKMPVQATTTSPWLFCVLGSLMFCTVMQWTELGSWSGFGPWWVLWSGSPCNLTKLCSYIWIGKKERVAARVSAFLDHSIIDAQRKSSYILVLIQFYFFRWNLMYSLGTWQNANFGSPSTCHWVRQVTRVFLSFQGTFFSCNQKQEAGIAVV